MNADILKPSLRGIVLLVDGKKDKARNHLEEAYRNRYLHVSIGERIGSGKRNLI